MSNVSFCSWSINQYLRNLPTCHSKPYLASCALSQLIYLSLLSLAIFLSHPRPHLVLYFLAAPTFVVMTQLSPPWVGFNKLCYYYQIYLGWRPSLYFLHVSCSYPFWSCCLRNQTYNAPFCWTKSWYWSLPNFTCSWLSYMELVSVNPRMIVPYILAQLSQRPTPAPFSSWYEWNPQTLFSFGRLGKAGRRRTSRSNRCGRFLPSLSFPGYRSLSGWLNSSTWFSYYSDPLISISASSHSLLFSRLSACSSALLWYCGCFVCNILEGRSKSTTAFWIRKPTLPCRSWCAFSVWGWLLGACSWPWIFGSLSTRGGPILPNPACKRNPNI